MKILYDYQIFLNQFAGGPSRYYYNLIKEISKSEDISICAPLYLNEYLVNTFKKSLIIDKVLLLYRRGFSTLKKR